MSKSIIIIVLFITILSCNQDVKKKNPQTNEIALKFDSLFSEDFSGTILVADKGNIVFTKNSGFSNENTKSQINLETIFELASVSKQFTAMAIVQLQKEGKLSYEDKLSKYIPELNHYDKITIKNLLTHTSGLPDYMYLVENFWDKSKIATNSDIINLFEKHKPKVYFEPNEEYEYSNTGYLFLASIIENASKRSYGDYLKDKIFMPLKMNNTLVYRRRFQPENIKNYALGYIYSDSLQKKMLPDELGNEHRTVYLDGTVGDGSVDSNVIDLLKWDRALYDNSIITDEDREQIFSSYKTNNGKDIKYGFGWNISNVSPYGKTASHAGSWPGYLTYIERHLDSDKTLILLVNDSRYRMKIPPLRKDIWKILYEIKS